MKDEWEEVGGTRVVNTHIRLDMTNEYTPIRMNAHRYECMHTEEEGEEERSLTETNECAERIHKGR